MAILKEVLTMAQMHAISLTALALVLGGGLPLSASAQPTYGAPPAYDAPPTRYQEPPPLGVPPRDREQPPGRVQLYSEPGKAAERPATSAPRPYPYAEPPPERMTDYPGDSGPGWSPPVPRYKFRISGHPLCIRRHRPGRTRGTPRPVPSELVKKLAKAVFTPRTSKKADHCTRETTHTR